MLNLLRFVVIVVTALIVFGWSVVAGQSTKQAQQVNPATEVSWNEVKDVTLEDLPEFPDRTVKTKRSHPVGRSAAYREGA